MLLHDWDRVLPRFWQVVPKDFVRYLPAPLTENSQAALRA
jgi:glutamate synthase (NADPH/NADH) large chain